MLDDKVSRYINKLKERKRRIETGLLNCIALPFMRLRRYVPGLEKSKYTIVTANQKVGKSKFTDYIAVYDPFFQSLNNDNLDIEVLYFTLEMSVESKMNEFFSHLLYRLNNIRVSPTDLKSTRSDKPLGSNILNLLESEVYTRVINKFVECVTYIEDIANPTGINKYCEDYAKSKGTLFYKNKVFKMTDGSTSTVRVIDKYVSNNPNLFTIIVLDNMANLVAESGMNKMQNIDTLSKYFVKLRDRYEFSIYSIQHQTQAQEGIENLKLDKMKPSIDGLADCKTTSRDANIIIGLYNPFKFGKKEYQNYDITQFKNYIRFAEIIDDRDNGSVGTICPLFFDGAVSSFNELPLPNEVKLLANFINKIRSFEGATNFGLLKKKTGVTLLTFSKRITNLWKK